MHFLDALLAKIMRFFGVMAKIIVNLVVWCTLHISHYYYFYDFYEFSVLALLLNVTDIISKLKPHIIY